MAKSTRGGLGRGLSSLMGSSNDGGTPAQRTKNRERVVYDENEDLYATGEMKSSSTGNLGLNSNSINNAAKTGPLNTRSVSRETYDYSSISIAENIEEENQLPKTTVNQTPVKENKIEETIDSSNQTPNEVDINLIEPNPDQPRTNFNKEELSELSASIKRDGLIQPILVREISDGKYQIIAGERRWQASKLAGLEVVPIRIKEVDDDKALELALIENLQRSDLNPIEEAYGYKRLMERRRMTQADVAQAMSKGRSTIANALRLLELPEEAQQLLFEDKISAGHARAILSVNSREGRESLTNKIIENKLSVRDAESLARLLSNKPSKPGKKDSIPASYKSVAKALKEILDTNVKVKSSKGKNKIEIEFKDERDLERIFEEIVGEE